jgi:hypothetical protein
MGDALVGQSFAARVKAAIDRTGPLCAGIDPSVSLLDAWGLSDDAAGIREFGARCVDAFAGVVPVVKPQVAFFERFGSAGIAALETLIRDARDAGLLVIADAKRGDIGSTMKAYASTWLDPRSPLVADAVTATPYLGSVRYNRCSTWPPSTVEESSWSCGARIPKAGPFRRHSPSRVTVLPSRTCCWLRLPSSMPEGFLCRERLGRWSAPPWRPPLFLWGLWVVRFLPPGWGHRAPRPAT